MKKSSKITFECNSFLKSANSLFQISVKRREYIFSKSLVEIKGHSLIIDFLIDKYSEIT